MTDERDGTSSGAENEQVTSEPETTEDTTSGGNAEQPDKPDAAVYGMADDRDEAGE